MAFEDRIIGFEVPLSWGIASYKNPDSQLYCSLAKLQQSPAKFLGYMAQSQSLPTSAESAAFP